MGLQGVMRVVRFGDFYRYFEKHSIVAGLFANTKIQTRKRGGISYSILRYLVSRVKISFDIANDTL